MPSKTKILSVLLCLGIMVPLLAIGLPYQPLVVDTYTSVVSTGNDDDVATMDGLFGTEIEFPAVYSQEESSSEAIASEASSAVSSEKPKEVIYTKEEIKEAVNKKPTAEDLAEDPGAHKQPDNSSSAPPEDTVSSGGTPPPSSSSQSSSSQESSSSSSSSSSSESSSSSSSTPSSNPIADGWQVINGKRYFYQNGKPITGWQIIGGRPYLFASGSGELTSKFGIDVSKYQKNIDWNAAKADGVEFAYIRIGYRGYGDAGNMVVDPYFEQNYKNARAAGIKVGVYFFSQAITELEAQQEAEFVLAALKGRALDLPVMFDPEFVSGVVGRLQAAGLNRDQQTACVVSFCNTIRANGRTAGLYTNLSWSQTRIDLSRIPNDSFWYARYVSTEKSKAETGRQASFWQYTSSGKINGISGNVDCDVWF